MKNVLLFLGCLVLCQAAGGLGTIATIPNIPTWYATLHKPSFNPPNWIFGPVWTLLFTLMSVSLYLIIKSSHDSKRKVLLLFAIQLTLNTLWSFLFFQFHLLFISLIEVVVLLATMVAFGITAYPISRTASYCFFPYIAWVSFATLLNAALLYLN